ncbi:hypothetical protein OF83DRAFT_494803 [Amylostereum chailletii]|nr:hypothetical protein OF83DRAFT_494803 [Amylostereum chailletii]
MLCTLHKSPRSAHLSNPTQLNSRSRRERGSHRWARPSIPDIGRCRLQSHSLTCARRIRTTHSSTLGPSTLSEDLGAKTGEARATRTPDYDVQTQSQGKVVAGGARGLRDSYGLDMCPIVGLRSRIISVFLFSPFQNPNLHKNGRRAHTYARPPLGIVCSGLSSATEDGAMINCGASGLKSRRRIRCYIPTVTYCPHHSFVLRTNRAFENNKLLGHIYGRGLVKMGVLQSDPQAVQDCTAPRFSITFWEGRLK